MHVYVAGPMRGKPDFNFPAFEAATKGLRTLGHEVFNPAERDLTAGFKSLGMTGHEDLSDQGFDLRAALNADLEYITLTADALCVLEGWENSSGARAEVATAHALGLPVVRNGGFLYSWAGKNAYRANYVVKPELAPSGKIASVTDLTTKRQIKYQLPDLSQTNTWNINPSDVSNTMTGIMQDKLDEKKSRTDHPAGKRRTDSDDATEYARYPLINPDNWHDPLPISAEQRLGFDPDTWPNSVGRDAKDAEGRLTDENVQLFLTNPNEWRRRREADNFRGLNEMNTAELRRKLAEPEHPEVSAVRKALDEELRSSETADRGEVRSVSSTGGEKGVKLDAFDLIPPHALTQIARHYGVGARKYAANQYRRGYEYSKSYAAMQRHLNQWWAGEDIDEETGSSHLAAAAWHCLTLLTFMEEHPEFDDRTKN